MERRSIIIRGIVQGVGFRPFVFSVATRLGLAGFVRNQTGGVLVEVEGPPAVLDAFVGELRSSAPQAARVESVEVTPAALRGETSFRILESEAGDAGPVAVSPDLATCPRCLAELFDPADRRHRYPFINCTLCGPRLTIIEGAPYDRQRTTMAPFVMCPACQREYDDPGDRRFHAQPNACATCGPSLKLYAGSPAVDTGSDDPLGAFAQAIRQGQIGALKGLGGYHLVCRAGSSQAVAELRRRKRRDEKPLAVMVRDREAAERLCLVSAAEGAALESSARPIVLLGKLPDGRSRGQVCDEVAPGNPTLGVMLPYTPVHHLLLDELAEPLVMTSGNASDEPIASDDADALERLAEIADVFLVHDRRIRVRCDDSVIRVVDGQELPLRRSRGYAPLPLISPAEAARPTLAVGGQLKSTFALGSERRVTLSHHLGDLDHLAAYEAFVRDVTLYEQLFAIRPERIVHDLHPDYASTRYAVERAAREGLARLAVQHHHAHLAGCLAEHGRSGPAIGVVFDGSGYGSDGAIWGGEFLVGDLRGFRRAAHWRYVPLPGGEQAIREPWRMAVAHLADAGLDRSLIAGRVSAGQLQGVEQLLEKRVQTPATSSVGRLFDAIASIAGVRDVCSYEGQAAMELEWLAAMAEGTDAESERREAVSLDEAEGSLVVDSRPLIAAAARETRDKLAPAIIARRFHHRLARATAEVCGRLRQDWGLNLVALSGGVFANAILSRWTCELLAADGFEVLCHRQLPPGDGGLAFGQWAVAAACGA